MNMEVSQLCTKPVPTWLVRLPSGEASFHPPLELFSLLKDLDPVLLRCAFRAAEAARLLVVLRNGIDVEPSDSVLFVDDFEKAWEYGGFPKLMLALDWKRLDPTWRELPASTQPGEIDAIRKDFPTIITSTDGSTFWMSRMPKSDPRIGTPYEIQYARWIPDNPFRALLGVILFSRPEDQEVLRTLLGGADIPG